MPYSRRERIGMWLQRRWWARPFVLEYNSTAADGRRRYVNRLSGHLVMR